MVAKGSYCRKGHGAGEGHRDKQATENARIAEENRVANEKRIEEATERARLKGIADEKARQEREQAEAYRKEKEAEEKRILAEQLRPDKDKLLAYAEILLNIPKPELSSEVSKSILNETNLSICDTYERLVSLTNQL